MFLFEYQITIIDFILCFLISIVSFTLYRNSKKKLLLQISYSFGLFTLNIIYSIFATNTIFKLPANIIIILAYSILISAILYELKIKAQINNTTNKIKRLPLFLITFIIFISLYVLSKMLISNPSIYNKFYIYYSFILNLITAGLSFIANRKKIKPLHLFSIGFSIFALLNLANIFELQTKIGMVIALLKIAAYLIILFGIYKLIGKNILKKILISTSNIKIQISILAIMTISIIVLFYIQTKSFSFMDKTEPILRIDEYSDTLNKIKTGLFINDFSTFDSEKNDFTFDGIVWFEFDPYEISINDIKSFSFGKGKILKKGEVKTKLINKKLLAYYPIKVNFKSHLNYRLFPLDDHKIYINLVNKNLDPKYKMFTSYNTNFLINKNISTGDWKISYHEVEYGYKENSFKRSDKINELIDYPVVSFEISFQKSGIRKTLEIFLPLYLIFFLSLFSLLIDVKNSNILSLSVGSTSALVFDLIAIDNMSPNVRYFTIANKIYILLLISAFTILLFNIYIIKKSKNETPGNLDHLRLLRSYVYLFFVFLTFTSTYLFIA